MSHHRILGGISRQRVTIAGVMVVVFVVINGFGLAVTEIERELAKENGE